MEVVLGLVCVTNAKLSLECFIRAEVESKAGSISDQHSLVASRETFESFCTVNACYFFSVTHSFNLAVLSSDLQQVKYERDVCVHSVGYQLAKSQVSFTYNPANTPDNKSFCQRLRLSLSFRYRLDHDLEVNSLTKVN